MTRKQQHLGSWRTLPRAASFFLARGALFAGVAASALLHDTASAGTTPVPTEVRPIAVVKSKSLPAYDQALAGLRAEYRGPIQTFDLDGRTENVAATMKAVLAIRPLAIVTIGALAAELARAQTLAVPIIYCLVLHPERFGLVRPGVVGVPLWIGADHQLAALRRLVPRLRRIGLIGNPANNRSQVQDIRRAARAQRLSIALTRIGTGEELPAALDQLLPRVHALWLLPDASILTGESFRFLLLKAFRRGIPVLAFARSFVRAGALAALSPDYGAMGRVAAARLRLALGATDAETRALANQAPARLAINTTTAQRLGLAVPADLLRTAEIVE